MEKGVASSYERFQRPRELIHGPWLDRLFDQARGGLAALESALGERNWLHGDAMTLADIYAVVLYDFMQIIDLPRLAETARVALPALSARLNALPAFQEHRFIPASA
jgi:glutathione S-transferase